MKAEELHKKCEITVDQVMQTIFHNKRSQRHQGEQRPLWLNTLAFNLNLAPSDPTARETKPMQKVDRIKLSRKITSHGGLYTFSAHASFLSSFTTIVVIDDDLKFLAETLNLMR